MTPTLKTKCDSEFSVDLLMSSDMGYIFLFASRGNLLGQHSLLVFSLLVFSFDVGD
jgi:hypothetical protein